MTTTASSLTSQASTYFAALNAHLHQWYHQPDIEALKVVLATAASHYTPADPVWLFAIGPPSTGKTAILIKSLTCAKNAHMVGDLTPNTLLSGREKRNGKGPASLLEQIGKSGIMLMKDFTTVLSKRPEDRAIIASQLREVYDGYFCKSTGMGAKVVWEGKITLIAACTPAIEREWMLLRDLGERFLSIRWEREKGTDAARSALKQRGKEAAIGLKTAQLANELLHRVAPEEGTLNPNQINRILAMSEVVALARNRVIRDSHGSREIIDLPPAEGGSRIAKALMAVVGGMSSLFHRDIEDSDLRLAARIACNSIPTQRFKLIASIPPNAYVSADELAEMTHIPRSSIEWHLDELAALGIVQEGPVAPGNARKVTHTDYFRTVWLDAFPPQI